MIAESEEFSTSWSSSGKQAKRRAGSLLNLLPISDKED
jgi:hypothetical protein